MPNRSLWVKNEDGPRLYYTLESIFTEISSFCWLFLTISYFTRCLLSVSANAESLGRFYSFIRAYDEIYIRRKPPNMSSGTYQRLTNQWLSIFHLDEKSWKEQNNRKNAWCYLTMGSLVSHLPGWNHNSFNAQMLGGKIKVRIPKKFIFSPFSETHREHIRLQIRKLKVCLPMVVKNGRKAKSSQGLILQTYRCWTFLIWAMPAFAFNNVITIHKMFHHEQNFTASQIYYVNCTKPPSPMMMISFYDFFVSSVLMVITKRNESISFEHRHLDALLYLKS